MQIIYLDKCDQTATMVSVMWKYVFGNSILILVISLCSSSLVSDDIIDRDLRQNWSIKFTIFAQYFNGDILYCKDTHINYVSVSVEQSINKKKYIKLQFNEKSVRKDTLHLCGCSSCDNQPMNLRINRYSEIIVLNCNDQGFVTLSVYKVDKASSNKSEISIALGRSVTNEKNNETAKNLEGCLQNFYFNDRQIHFKLNRNNDDISNDTLSDCKQRKTTNKPTTVTTSHLTTRTAKVNTEDTRSMITQIISKVTNTRKYITSITKLSTPPSTKGSERNNSLNFTSRMVEQKSIASINDSIDQTLTTFVAADSCYAETQIWRTAFFVALVILIIMIIIINKQRMETCILNIKKKISSEEEQTNESNPKEETLDVYSSLSASRRNSSLPPATGSDTGYLQPGLSVYVESKPSVPPRDKPGHYQSVEKRRGDSVYQSLADIRSSECSVLKELDEDYLDTHEDKPILPPRGVETIYTSKC